MKRMRPPKLKMRYKRHKLKHMRDFLTTASAFYTNQHRRYRRALHFSDLGR